MTKPVPDPSGCVWQVPVRRGSVGAGKLTELSGLAASRTHPGLFWAHNDAGNKPYLFLISSDGNTKATYHLVGAPNTDWEDIAVGPCQPPSATLPAPPPCVWVGDIGDNGAVRPKVALLRFAEPTALPSAKKADNVVDVTATEWDSVAFGYADGPQNAESLAILPDGRAIVLTKRDDGTTVAYRVDSGVALVAQQAEAKVERLGQIHLAVGAQTSGQGVRATGADLDLAGGALTVRTYSTVQLFRQAQLLADPASATLVAKLGQWQSLALPSPAETQGESVAWDSQGVLWCASEGSAPAIYEIACTKP